MLILFIRYKRTLIALLKLYAAAANNTLIASPLTSLLKLRDNRWSALRRSCLPPLGRLSFINCPTIAEQETQFRNALTHTTKNKILTFSTPQRCKHFFKQTKPCNFLYFNALQYPLFGNAKAPVLHAKSAYIATPNSLLSDLACTFFTNQRPSLHPPHKFFRLTERGKIDIVGVKLM